MATAPILSFRLLSSSGPLGTRVGQLSLSRKTLGASDAQPSPTIAYPTPTFVCMTSRGVVPHLSWDHVKLTEAIGWTHVPFESFLEQNPPVPTIVGGNTPLHSFLGFNPDRHIISVSLRDWNNGQDIPPNGKDYVSSLCVRGVKTVTPPAYNGYVAAIKPDVTFALSDIPITDTPPSEKRIIKSLERSLRWIGQLLRSSPPNVFVHLAGGVSDVAREDFATGLLEPLEGADARELQPLGLHKLDDGISGYSVDLTPLKKHAPGFTIDSGPSVSGNPLSLTNLIQLSLRPLPEHKPRLVTGCISPHEMLALMQSGIDLFDSAFAQRAADWGVALDFVFPAPGGSGDASSEVSDIGVNLYDAAHEMSFSRLSSNHAGRFEVDVSRAEAVRRMCDCIACSPSFNDSPISHSSQDPTPGVSTSAKEYARPFTRAYIHHLLHTHEMSAHALLAAHNITILSGFFDTVRELLARNAASFGEEVRRFEKYYRKPDVAGGVMEVAKREYEAVDFARGKGRLAREKASKEPLVDDISI